MSIATPHRTDHDIQSAVQDELEWTPGLDAAALGVAAEHGAVSLSGKVTTYLQRRAASKAALRVRGERALVDNIVVNSKSNFVQTETDLATSVQRALEFNSNIPAAVKAELNGRVVTLIGEVEWDFERQNARRAVQAIAGIERLDNEITLRARPADTAAAHQISAALERNASLDDTEVAVHVIGTTAKLTGSVRTWAQRHTAETVAWSSPHITHLDDEIVVNWF